MSLAQTQTRGSEAKHIGLPTNARQQKTAQGNPCASYRVKRQTMLATPNPLPAEQAESVSSNKRGHQQLGSRTTWWSALAKFLQLSFFQCHTMLPSRLCSSKLPSNGANCPDTTSQGIKRVLREERSFCCNLRKRHVFFFFFFFLGGKAIHYICETHM